MSSGISFTCDVCGREVYGCNIVNGMKFCAKCYQETFGNQQNKENSELLVNSIAEKDKQIAELKQQLEEKDKDIKYFKESYYMIQDEKDHYAGQCLNLQDSIEELEKNNKRIRKNWENSKTQQTRLYNNLKQQLKSQPAEIVEKIKNKIFNHFNVNNMEEYESLSMLDSLFTADAVTDMLDNILKEYQK